MEDGEAPEERRRMMVPERADGAACEQHEQGRRASVVEAEVLSRLVGPVTSRLVLGEVVVLAVV